MDSFNRCLWWSLDDLLPYCLRQVKRYGNEYENILSHAISIHENELKLYFPFNYINDLKAIIIFMEINIGNKCYLIDTLILLIIFTLGPINVKINYLFDFFDINSKGYIDEKEFLLLLIRSRSCLRKLGIKSLEYTLDDLQHMAFMARLPSIENLVESLNTLNNTTNTTEKLLTDDDQSIKLLKQLTRAELIMWAESNPESKAITILVNTFREANYFITSIKARTEYLHTLYMRMIDDAKSLSFIPAPPYHQLLPDLSIVNRPCYITLCTHNRITICAPRSFNSLHQVFVKIDREYVIDEAGLKLLGTSAENKYSVYSVHNLYDVDDDNDSPYMRIDIANLEPSQVYSFTLYTDTIRLPTCFTSMLPLPSEGSKCAVLILSSAIGTSSQHLRIIRELRHKYPSNALIFTGSLFEPQACVSHFLAKNNRDHSEFFNAFSSVFRQTHLRSAILGLHRLFNLKEASASDLKTTSCHTQHLMLFCLKPLIPLTKEISEFIDVLVRLKYFSALQNICNAFHDKLMATISPANFEWQRGQLKIICFDTSTQSPLESLFWLRNLRLELLNAAYASCTSHIIMLITSPQDLYFKIPEVLADDTPMSRERAEKKLSGRYELEYGAYSESAKTKERDLTIFINPLLDVLSAWVANNNIARKVTLISTAWIKGLNFTLQRDPGISIRHECLLATSIETNSSLAVLQDTLGDDFTMQVNPASDCRSVYIDSLNSEDLGFIPIQYQPMPVAEEVFTPLILSNPKIKKLTSSDVEIAIESHSHYGTLKCTLFRLLFKVSHEFMQHILQFEREKLNEMASCYVELSATPTTYISFSNLISNSSYCISIDSSSVEPTFCSFTTLPSISNLLYTCVLTSRVSDFSKYSRRVFYPKPIVDLFSSNRPCFHPSFAVDIILERAYVKTFDIYQSISLLFPISDSTIEEVGKIVHSCRQGDCCILSPLDSKTVSLQALVDYIQEIIFDDSILVLIVLLPLSIPIFHRKFSKTTPLVSGYSFTSPLWCYSFISALFSWRNRMSERSCTIISYGWVTDSTCFHILKRNESRPIPHVIIPQRQADGENEGIPVDSFATGKCVLRHDIFYEMCEISSFKQSIIIKIPSPKFVDLASGTDGEQTSKSLLLSYLINIYCKSTPWQENTDHVVELRGISTSLSAVCDAVGPIISKVTPTTATISFEFTTDVKRLDCLLESDSSSVSLQKSNIKAFTLVSFQFESLRPGTLYSIILPAIKSSRLGKFVTTYPNPSVLDLIFLSEGVFNNNKGFEFLLREFAIQRPFDLPKLVSIMENCFSDERHIPQQFSKILSRITCPIFPPEHIIHIGSRSILLDNFDAMSAIVKHVIDSSSTGENDNDSHLVGILKMEELLDLVKDSFRIGLLVPAYGIIVKNAINDYFPLAKYTSISKSAVSINDKVLETFQNVFTLEIDKYLSLEYPPETDDFISVERLGSIAKIKILPRNSKLLYLDSVQIVRIKRILQDNRLKQLMFYSEHPLLVNGLPSSTLDAEDLSFNVEDFLSFLFDWLHQSSERDAKLICFVAASSNNYITEIENEISGCKIYQFSIGAFIKCSLTSQLKNQQKLFDSTIGFFKIRHILNDGLTYRCSCDGNASPIACIDRPITPESGFCTLQIFADNVYPCFQWKLDRNDGIEDIFPPLMTVGPILGILETEGDLSSEESSSSRLLWLPVLFEADNDTVLHLECIQCFTSQTFLFSLELAKNRPSVLRLGPLEQNSRFSCIILDGVDNPSNYSFEFSTFYSKDDSNYIFINCSKSSSDQISYDFIGDLSKRFQVPFHGVSTLVHLNAGLDVYSLIDKISVSDFLPLLTESRLSHALVDGLRNLISELYCAFRKKLREVFNQPSYAMLCKAAFNVFIPNQCELATAVDDGDFHRLSSIIIQYLYGVYFDALLNSSKLFPDENVVSVIYERWIVLPSFSSKRVIFTAVNKMITVEDINLLNPLTSEAVLSDVSFARIDCRIRILIISSGPRVSSTTASDLLSAQSQVGYKFQKAMKQWLHENPARKLLVLCPVDNEGTGLRMLPVEDDKIDPFSVYLIQSSYRSNRFLHDVKLAEVEENFRSLSLPIVGNNTSALKRRKEETDLLAATLKRKSDEIWDSLIQDGFIAIECQYIDMSTCDVTMDHVLSYEVCVVGSKSIKDESNHYDFLQPPSWLSTYIPNEPGLFILDEVLLYAKSSIENQEFLVYLESDAFKKIMQHTYISSKLHLIAQENAIKYVGGYNPSLERAVRDFLGFIWNEIVPIHFRMKLPYLLDPFIAAYALGSARVLESCSDINNFIDRMKISLVYCIGIKTCMTMRKLKRWDSSLFTTNVVDTRKSLREEAYSAADSDLAELIKEEEEQRKIASNEDIISAGDSGPPGKLVLNFKKPASESVSLKMSAGDESAKNNSVIIKSEIERRKNLRIAHLRSIGSKLNYIKKFRFSLAVEEA